jgi:RNA polymerase sigma factor (sigma-70 family)
MPDVSDVKDKCFSHKAALADKQRRKHMSKKFYITLQGAKIVVAEEVYRAYIQPFWKDKKRRQRQVAGGSIPLSLDQLLEDNESGFDIAGETDIEAEVMQKIDSEEIHRILAQLPESDRAIIYGLIYDQKTERELAAELGMSQKTVNNHRRRILGKLHENGRLFELWKNY